MKADEKNARIIECALDLFYHFGIEETSMGMIAECSNIPRGTLYEYFNNKDAILSDIMNRCLSLVEEDMSTLDGMTECESRKALSVFTEKMIGLITGKDRRFTPVNQELLINGMVKSGEGNALVAQYREIFVRYWKMIIGILSVPKKIQDICYIRQSAYLILVLYLLLEDATFYFSENGMNEYLDLAREYIMTFLDTE